MALLSAPDFLPVPLALDSVNELRLRGEKVQEDQSQLPKVLETFRARLESEMVHLHADPPPLLHHYTNASGLCGIFPSRSIWASHSAYLNDESESSYALELFREVLREEAAQSADKRYKQDIEAHVDRLEFPLTRTDIYVVCFCERDDLLSQWRGYGGGTGGYAIGFEPRQWRFSD